MYAVESLVSQFLPSPLTEVSLPAEWGLERFQGKVRDIYPLGENHLLVIATDRLSAFDRVLTHIPGRGQILTGLASWWFEKTQDIIPNHLVAVPDPNVMVVRKFPRIDLEMVVRGFVTGSTDTSIWKRYQAGEREFGGLVLPDELRKNVPLTYPIIDPTTKAVAGHDQKVTELGILQEGIATPLEWQALKTTALALFARGQALARQAGLILVDTKYEFGRDSKTGNIVLIDEIHTPDSSRFWREDTYTDRLEEDREPDNFDKEYARLWYQQQGYKGEGEPPIMPDPVVSRVLERYETAYEKLTSQSFEPFHGNVQQRIIDNIEAGLRQGDFLI